MSVERRVQVGLRLPVGLLERVDGARGDVPRARWIERALEAALSVEVVLDPVSAAAPVGVTRQVTVGSSLGAEDRLRAAEARAAAFRGRL